MSSLEALLLRYPRCLWRGRNAVAAPAGGIPAVLPALKELLPGGFWPVGALVEIISRSGEEGVHLLLPAMQYLARRDRCIAWIVPPHPPHGPALVAGGLPTESLFIIRPPEARQELWALEQLLRSTECGLAFCWPGTWTAPISRRLRLAAAEGGGLGVVFLRAAQRLPFSFAALRLAVNGSGVQLLKGVAGQEREAVVEEFS